MAALYNKNWLVIVIHIPLCGVINKNPVIATICKVVLIFPIYDTATLVRFPSSAIHSRNAEITISRPMITIAGKLNHHE